MNAKNMPSANAALPTSADLSEAADESAVPPARLGDALRQTAREAWDKLGLVVGTSLTWTLLMSAALGFERLVPRAIPLPAHMFVVAAALLLIMSLPLGGLCYLAHLIATRDELSYGAFWRGGIQFYRSILTLAGIDLAVTIALAANGWFYSRLGNIGGLAIMLLCLYLLLFWQMMAVTHFPLLIAQEMGVFDEPEKRARRGTFAVLRRAFYLVLGRPFYTIGVLIVMLLFTILCSITGILFALLWPACLALFGTFAIRGLLRQYGVLPPLPPVEPIIPDEKFRIQSAKPIRQDQQGV